jgi:Fe-S-cluster containining protein
MNKPVAHRAATVASPWYARGLRFRCKRCGRCCTGEPGYVWVSQDEIHRIARFLNLSEDEFSSKYCRRVLIKISLVERPNGDCIFFTPAGCQIYPVRPLQCRTFPFWDDIISSPENWQAASYRCPGIGSGRLYSRKEIEAINKGEQTT